ncbi:MAG TPA: hypothetical protein VFI41_04855 [Gemmatimonadales bacterium]|nr:hypothetical protein [Gemmatimonadales bacterium]
MNAPACRSCGDPIGFNPKAQATWERVHGAEAGTVPGAGWFHHAWPHKTDEQGNDIPGTGKYSMSRNDPDFHYAVPPPGVNGPGVAASAQASRDQAKEHIKKHLSRQFDFLAAEKRGGRHIDLSED